ncbi:hypothetical protein TNCV_556821 [Trichonephila clavipes]|uniref:Uncharacterized protein n=1 Tax=Trichonephila clavipes TaxID=2585209 RepID=A0A8X6RQI5_TRICX|nr:hypothetical protein TNCV_556821 [Trichonephila clavipes]
MRNEVARRRLKEVVKVLSRPPRPPARLKIAEKERKHWVKGGLRLIERATASLHRGVLVSITFRTLSDRRSLMVKVMDSWLACHEFDSSVAENSKCREGHFTLNMLMLKRPPVGAEIEIEWCRYTGVIRIF